MCSCLGVVTMDNYIISVSFRWLVVVSSICFFSSCSSSHIIDNESVLKDTSDALILDDIIIPSPVVVIPPAVIEESDPFHSEAELIKVTFYNIHPENKHQYISFGFPLPPMFSGKINSISILDQDRNEIPSHISSSVSLFDFKSHKPMPGSLKITIKKKYGDAGQSIYVFLNSKHQRSIKLPDNYNVRSEWSNFTDNNYPGYRSMKEPSVYAALPSSWLIRCKILGDSIAINEYSKMGWFDRAYLNFSHTAVNNVSKYVKQEYLISLSDKAEPWLFDRTKTLYGIYIRTGDVFWLKHAHRSAEFYRHNINKNGFFGLKKSNDLKYSYPLAFVLDVLFTVDEGLFDIIRLSANSTLSWLPQYINEKKFWTERHQNYALLAAVVTYQISGELKYKKRVLELIDSSYSLFNPSAFKWKGSDCMLHTMQSHEGVNNSQPVCSPWMSALFSETLMRYYSVSDDLRALDMIKRLADFVANHSLYTDVKYSKFKDMLVPWYLASHTVKFSDSGIFADWEHSCDVAGLLARGIVIKKKLFESTEIAEKKLNKLLGACYSNLNNWVRDGSDFRYGKPVWRLAPFRKYSWVFGSTFDLPWSMKQIDSSSK